MIVIKAEIIIIVSQVVVKIIGTVYKSTYSSPFALHVLCRALCIAAVNTLLPFHSRGRFLSSCSCDMVWAYGLSGVVGVMIKLVLSCGGASDYGAG